MGGMGARVVGTTPETREGITLTLRACAPVGAREGLRTLRHGGSQSVVARGFALVLSAAKGRAVGASMRALWLLLTVLLGCSPGVHVYVGSDEPDTLIEATSLAVERWNESLGVDILEVRVSDTPRAARVDAFSILVRSCERAEGPADRNAYTKARGLWATVSVERGALRLFDDREREWLITHELGHAFGLVHVEGDNLMHDAYWTEDETFSTTRAQRRRVRAVLGLESLSAW